MGIERTVINNDCLEVLKYLPDQSMPLAITSPPYNMNLRIRAGKYCSRQIVKEITTKYKNYPDNLPIDDYFELNKAVLGELIRVCDTVFYNVQFLTGNKRALYKLIGHFSDNIKEFIIWDKVNSEPAIGSGILNSRWEAVLVLQKDDKAISRKFENSSFSRGALENIWQIKRGKKVHKEHGAVFPSELVDKIILNFSKEGDTVLDPFAGTGTVGESCNRLGRGYFLVEKDEEYFKFITDRLKK